MVFFKKFKPSLHSTQYIQLVSLVNNKKLFSSSAVFRISESISFTNVKASKYQHITLIALNRPDDKNRLNAETLSDLKKAILNFENDSSSTIGILYGEGGSFCAGLDPEETVKEPQIYDDFFKSHCQKPIIAAVSGFAYDIGFDLCLWCDLRIVEENAVMAIDRKSEVPKSKLFLKRLLKTVGYSKAMDLLLTGRDMYTKEAFECGLANRIVACGSSIGQAVNMASNIGKFPQLTVNKDRSTIHQMTLK